MNQAMWDWKRHKKEDIMGFRNRTFRSLLTGTPSPMHHTPWLEAMDDSLESFLGYLSNNSVNKIPVWPNNCQ